MKIKEEKGNNDFYDLKKIKKATKEAFNQDDKEIFAKNIRELAKK